MAEEVRNPFKLNTYLAEPTNATGTYYPVSVLAVSIMASSAPHPSTSELYHIGMVESIDITQSRNVQRIRQIEAYPNVVMGQYSQTNIDYSFGFKLGKKPPESFFPGEVVVIVPGGLGDLDLRIRRVDLVNSLAIEALLFANADPEDSMVGYEKVPEGTNYVDIHNIGDIGRVVSLLLQRKPVSIFEFIFNPAVGRAPVLQDNDGKPAGLGIAYQDGWITSMGHRLELGGGGNITTIPDIQLAVTRIRPFIFYAKDTE